MWGGQQRIYTHLMFCYWRKRLCQQTAHVRYENKIGKKKEQKKPIE